MPTPLVRFHQEALEAVQEATKLETEVRNLLTSQKFAVLSTQEQDHPYVNLVAFAETSDLRTILFATMRTTRKYGNMLNKSGVALLVDNRPNEVADIGRAMAVTIIGTASEVPDSERDARDRLYLEKQPHMKDFLYSPSTALINVDVEFYLLVSRFQDVAILNLKS
jgi:nitroimidazol reductase NimA-like FMN-containing flavoprotein (pyridoxamine 5'-phosphate oxidase superfamily)